MSTQPGYQDFFKKRTEILKKQTQTKTRNRFTARIPTKHLRGQNVWLVIIACILAGGCIWYLYMGDEKAEKLLSKVEISMFGEANAEEKSAADTPPTEAKDAAGEADKTTTTTTSTKSWSDEELALFTKLESRKKQLDAKEQELTKLDEELQKHKAELEQKLTALEDIRTKIAAKLDDKVKIDEKKVEALVSVYANMKPVQAAKIIEGLNEDLAVEVLAKMKNKNAAEIVNLMDAERAKKISEHFAGFHEPAMASGPMPASVK